MKVQAYRNDDGRYRCRFVDADGASVSVKVGSVAAGREPSDTVERAIDGALKRLAAADARLTGRAGA